MFPRVEDADRYQNNLYHGQLIQPQTLVQVRSAISNRMALPGPNGTHAGYHGTGWEMSCQQINSQ